MEKWKKILALLIVFSSNGNAANFTKSMKIASEDYQRVRSQKYQIEAAHKQVQAIWLSWLPSAALNYSKTIGSNDVGGTDFRTRNDSSSIGASFNLFDGGALYFSARAAEYGLLTREESLRSMQMGFATQVAQTYLTYSSAGGQIIRLHNINSFLRKLKEKITSQPDMIPVVDNTIGLNDNSIQSFSTNKRKAELLIQQLTGELPQKIPGLPNESDVTTHSQATTSEENDIRDNLKQQKARIDQMFPLPASLESAIEIAGQKSPNILSAYHQLDAVRNQRNSTYANSYSPRVDLNVRQYWSDDDVSGVDSSGQSLTLSVTIPLSVSSIPRSQAAQLEFQAANQDVVAALLETRTTIESAYLESADLNRSYDQISEVLVRTVSEYKKIIKEANGKKIDVNNALNLINQLQSVSSSIEQIMAGMIMVRIQALGQIGTLLEEIERMIPLEEAWDREDGIEN